MLKSGICSKVHRAKLNAPVTSHSSLAYAEEVHGGCGVVLLDAHDHLQVTSSATVVLDGFSSDLRSHCICELWHGAARLFPFQSESCAASVRFEQGQLKPLTPAPRDSTAPGEVPQVPGGQHNICKQRLMTSHDS